LSCFCFSAFACLASFCFCPLALSFLPFLSPIRQLLSGLVRYISPRVRVPVINVYDTPPPTPCILTPCASPHAPVARGAAGRCRSHTLAACAASCNSLGREPSLLHTSPCKTPPGSRSVDLVFRNGPLCGRNRCFFAVLPGHGTMATSLPIFSKMTWYGSICRQTPLFLAIRPPQFLLPHLTCRSG
jgi:hypothetical protein